jgi:hypothetical protein
MEQSPLTEANSHSASQEIPAFYRTRRFISVFTRARPWSLSWTRWICWKHFMIGQFFFFFFFFFFFVCVCVKKCLALSNVIDLWFLPTAGGNVGCRHGDPGLVSCTGSNFWSFRSLPCWRSVSSGTGTGPAVAADQSRGLQPAPSHSPGGSSVSPCCDLESEVCTQQEILCSHELMPCGGGGGCCVVPQTTHYAPNVHINVVLPTRIKINLSPCLIKHHAFNLISIWKWMVTFALRPLYS